MRFLLLNAVVLPVIAAALLFAAADAQRAADTQSAANADGISTPETPNTVVQNKAHKRPRVLHLPIRAIEKRRPGKLQMPKIKVATLLGRIGKKPRRGLGSRLGGLFGRKTAKKAPTTKKAPTIKKAGGRKLFGGLFGRRKPKAITNKVFEEAEGSGMDEESSGVAPANQTFDQIADHAFWRQKVVSNVHREFIVPITLGNPPQVIHVQVDTGSTRLWVPLVGCSHTQASVRRICEQGGADLFDNSNSEALGAPHDAEVIFSYADNSAAVGHWFKDYFAFGDASGPDGYGTVGTLPLVDGESNVEKITFMGADFLSDVGRGTLGLGLPRNEPPATQMVKEWHDRDLLDEYMFTVYMRDVTKFPSNSGILTIGGSDPQNCGDILGEAVVGFLFQRADFQVPGGHHWAFQITRISLVVSSNVVNTFNYPNFFGIADTGATEMYLPTADFNLLIGAIQAQPFHGIYLVPCQVDFYLRVRVGDHTYKVPNKVLVSKYGDDGIWCELRVAAGSAAGPNAMGMPWMQSVCNEFHIGQRKLVFRKRLH